MSVTSVDVQDASIELKLLKRHDSKEPVYFRDGQKRIDYVLAYDKSKTEHNEARERFEKCLKDQGLELEYESLQKHETTDDEDDDKKKVSFVKIHATWKVLCKWAEMSRMPKPIAKNDLANYSTDLDWKAPCSSFWKKVTAVPHPKKYNYTFSDHENDDTYFTAPFDERRIDKFMIDKEDDFFTTAERQRIVLNILNRTRFGDGEFDVGITRLIDKQIYFTSFPLHEGDWRPEHLKNEGSTNGEILNKRQTLYWIWARPGMWFSTQPLELVRQYFGEKIGMYFAWLGFYTIMLIPVSIIGILVFIYGLGLIGNDIICKEVCNSNLTMCPRCDYDCPFWKLSTSCNYTYISRVFDNELTFFFAFIMSLWATIFLEFWKRKRAQLVYKWDLENFEEEEDQIRPEYEGLCKNKKVNPVTGHHEPYLPVYMRVPRLLISCSAFFVLLTLVIGAVFGVVIYRIIIAALLPRESSGVIKENSSLITSISASCINFVIITILNFIYEKIAEKLTNMEAPRTATDFEDSFTLKMFLFQAVNYYSSIVYIAFFKGKFIGTPYNYNRILRYRSEECDPSGCLTELCIQLGIIMILKQALNNTKEIVIPLLKNWWSKRSFLKIKDEQDVVGCFEDLHETALYRDYLLEDPGRRYLFSEYLEMVIQYGFVTLFVASFPLAPLFALINNVIEIRLDAYKFTTQIRRLPSRRCENIGMWFPILKALSILAVITNGLVLALTSEFVPRLVYRLLYSPCVGVEDTSNMYCLEGYVNATLVKINVSEIDDTPRYNTSEPGVPEFCWFRSNTPELEVQPLISFWHVFAGRILLLVVFEHAVFGLQLLIDLLIPDVPLELSQQMSRQKYLELKLLYDKGDKDEPESKDVPGGSKTLVTEISEKNGG